MVLKTIMLPLGESIGIPSDGEEDWNTYLIRNQLIPIPQMELTTNDMISIEDQNPGYSK